MAHTHSIIDSDASFKINPDTMEIIADAAAKKVLMQNDHRAERITFEIPRYIEEHDMLNCNAVEVHYINIDTNTRAESRDIYTVDDCVVSEVDETKINFSWLISGSATKYAGHLNFVIRFACLDGETIEYQRFTNIYKGITIASSICNNEVIAQDYSDILAKCRTEQTNQNSGAQIVQLREMV